MSRVASEYLDVGPMAASNIAAVSQRLDVDPRRLVERLQLLASVLARIDRAARYNVERCLVDKYGSGYCLLCLDAVAFDETPMVVINNQFRPQEHC